jgi:exonuclease V gamma subunit
MKKYVFRPDLTDYLPYIHALTDKLNEESSLKMSLTDAVKIAIEQACKNVLPDIRIEKKRKLYQTLKM